MEEILDKKTDKTFSELNKHSSAKIESAHSIPVKINEIQYILRHVITLH